MERSRISELPPRGLHLVSPILSLFKAISKHHNELEHCLSQLNTDLPQSLAVLLSAKNRVPKNT